MSLPRFGTLTIYFGSGFKSVLRKNVHYWFSTRSGYVGPQKTLRSIQSTRRMIIIEIKPVGGSFFAARERQCTAAGNEIN